MNSRKISEIVASHLQRSIRSIVTTSSDMIHNTNLVAHGQQEASYAIVRCHGRSRVSERSEQVIGHGQRDHQGRREPSDCSRSQRDTMRHAMQQHDMEKDRMI